MPFPLYEVATAHVPDFGVNRNTKNMRYAASSQSRHQLNSAARKILQMRLRAQLSNAEFAACSGLPALSGAQVIANIEQGMTALCLDTAAGILGRFISFTQPSLIFWSPARPPCPLARAMEAQEAYASNPWRMYLEFTLLHRGTDVLCPPSSHGVGMGSLFWTFAWPILAIRAPKKSFFLSGMVAVPV